MLRKLLGIGVVCLAVAVLLAGDLALVAPAPVSAAPPAQATEPAGRYLWNYSVKFVCGLQPFDPTGAAATGEPVVKPGNYATEINIHNYTYRQVPLGKKVLILVKDATVEGRVGREPKPVEPVVFDMIQLPPDGATMDDCNRIWALTKTNLTANNPRPLTIGYLVILSPVDLDIDAVYTAQVIAALGGQPGPLAVSIDVERVQGKRVFVPTDYLKKFPTQPVP
jgi:hypothetical protein